MDNRAGAVDGAAAWNRGVTGFPVDIAIIDSGIPPQPDLNSRWGYRIDYSESFVPNVTATTDAYGHGTHVAGIAVGNGAASAGYYDYRRFSGIAPGACLVNLKGLDANGAGSDSSVIAAIDRPIALRDVYNLR